MLSGDYIIKPIDGDDQMAKDLIGLKAADPEAIRQKIQETVRMIGIEAIMMGPEDFAIPVIEACQKASKKER
jgi:hypothetical protein